MCGILCIIIKAIFVREYSFERSERNANFKLLLDIKADEIILKPNDIKSFRVYS